MQGEVRMGFFNSFLKGLGFEDEEEPKKVKVKEKKDKKEKKVTASFDLNKFEDEALDKKEEVEETTVEEQTPNTQNAFEIVNVSSQVEVQEVVNKLKRGDKILINLSKLSGSDLTRSLDFLTGAVYALNLGMQKVDGMVYLIQ